MLLTSWIRSLRRRLAWSHCAVQRRRRPQSRIGLADYAATPVLGRPETLEDRVLLTSLVIDQPPTIMGNPGPGVDIDNADLAGFDGLVIEHVTITGNGGPGVQVVLSDLTLQTITIETVTLNANNGPQIQIVLDNVDLGTLVMDTVDVTRGIDPGIQLQLTDSNVGTVTITDSTVTPGGSSTGPGIDITLDSTKIEEFTFSRNMADGVRVLATSSTNGTVFGATNATPIVINSPSHGLDTGDSVRIEGVMGNTAANGDFTITVVDPHNFSLNGSSGNAAYTGGGTWQVRSELNNAVFRENTLMGASGSDGITIDLTDSDASNLRIEDNAQIDGILVALTGSPLDGATIVNNTLIDATASDGIFFDLDNSNVTNFTISNNSIVGDGMTGGDGLRIDANDSNVTGRIQNNTIDNVVGDGIDVDGSASAQFVTANGGPARLDFSPLANEIQSVALLGNPTGGTFTLTFDTRTTGPIAYNANAAQIQAALEALPNINPGEVIVRGFDLPRNIVTVEFLGRYTHSDVPEMTADASGLTGGTDPQVMISTVVPGEDDRTVAGDGLRANTITNALGYGVRVGDPATGLPQNVRFLAAVTGNTITGNQSGGFELTVKDTDGAFDLQFGGPNGADRNRMEQNRNRHLGITMLDAATGAFTIQGNTFLSSEGPGDAIVITQSGTSTMFEATNVLHRSIIDDNLIGTPAHSTLSTGVNNFANTITVADATPFSTELTLPFTIQIEAEQMQVTNIVGNTLTVTRGFGGTTAAPHAAGVDVVAVTGGNNQNGIVIDTQENSTIEDLHITDNVVANQAGDGLHFMRDGNAQLLTVDPLPGQQRAVTVAGNAFIGNAGDGIDLKAINGSRDLLDFHVFDNEILASGVVGVRLRTEADARMLVDLEYNRIQYSGGDGVNLTTAGLGSDSRQIGGTWTKNTITANAGDAIELSGVHGLLDPFTGIAKPVVIGLEGPDPEDGRDQGNNLSSNAGYGLLVTAGGEIVVANNTIGSNSNGGIRIAASQTASIKGNFISQNFGTGIDLEGKITATIRDNSIGANVGDESDGIEITAPGGQSNYILTGNTINNNGARGLDVLNYGGSFMKLKIGDPTLPDDAGMNTFVDNGKEGIYVVNSAGVVPQTGVAPLTLTAMGSPDAAPDLVLNVDTNVIEGNGSLNSSQLGDNGLVVRVGTAGSGSGSGGLATSLDPVDIIDGISGGHGAFGLPDMTFGGRGQVNARIVNNTFEGNFGDDITFDAFVSTADPATTSGTWDSNTFSLNSIQPDPLSRLNALVEGNTGNGIDAASGGASYGNDEPVFKSRRSNQNPAGPYPSGTRGRNALVLGMRSFPDDGLPGGPAPLPPLVPPNPPGLFEFVYPGEAPISTWRVQAGFDEVGATEEFVMGTDFNSGRWDTVGALLDAPIDGSAITIELDYPIDRTTAPSWLDTLLRFPGLKALDDNGTPFDVLVGDEQMRVTGVDFANDTLTVQRGVNGTTAHPHDAGTPVIPIDYMFTFPDPTPATFPLVDIIDVDPDPRSTAADDIGVHFFENSSNVDINDFRLAFDNGSSLDPVPIAAATNTAPIVITSFDHGLKTGDEIVVADVNGNTAANGVWTVTVIDRDTFQLNGSDGTTSGVYNGVGGVWRNATAGRIFGATNEAPIRITSPRHGLSEGDFVVVEDVRGVGTANGIFQVSGIDEIQTLSVEEPIAGTFTLTFEGQTTAPLNFNATAGQIDAALEALSTIGSGNVVVTGGPINVAPVDVRFTGRFAGTDVSLLQVDASNLTGRNERQTVFLDNAPAGGTFTLRFGTQTTLPISANATAGQLDAALEALPAIPSGGVNVTGGPGLWFVEFTGAMAEMNQPELVPDSTGLQVNEQQQLQLNGTPTAGTFELSFNGASTGDTISFNADAMAIQTALENLPTIGPGNVVVTGGPIDMAPVTIEFVGMLAATDVSQIVFSDPDGDLQDAAMNQVTGTVTTLQEPSTAFVFTAQDGTNPRGTFLVTETNKGTADSFALVNSDGDDPRIPLYDGGGRWTKLVDISSGTVTGTNEIQQVQLTGNPTGGFFTLIFDGATTGDANLQTAQIPFNATPADIQATLEALPDPLTGGFFDTLAGDVVVTGTGPMGNEPINQYPVRVEFVGDYANRNVFPLRANPAGLTGGSNPNVLITTVQEGTGKDYSIDLSNPGLTDRQGHYTLFVATNAINKLAFPNLIRDEYFLPLVNAVNGQGDALNYAAIDRWTVDTDPPVATLETIDPDPRNSAVGVVTITFDEDVTGVDLADFQLLRDGNPVSLSGLSVTQISPREYSIDLNLVTGAAGNYTLNLVTTDVTTPIRDLAGNAPQDLISPGIHAQTTWTTDVTQPTVQSIGPVSPDPRNTGVGTLDVVFSKPVGTADVDVGDFRLEVDSGNGFMNIPLTGATVTPVGGMGGFADTFQIDLSAPGLTDTIEGTYRLTLVAAASGIRDADGNRLQLDASETWVLDLTPPGADVVDVKPDPRMTDAGVVNILFDEPVSGVTLSDASVDLQLRRSIAVTDATNGTPIQITAPGHHLPNGQLVNVSGVTGNEAANGTFTITLADEIQQLDTQGTVGGGTFTLQFGTAVTGPLNYDATATDIQAALEALGNIGAGNVTVTGGPLNVAPIRVQFTNALAATDVPLLLADTTNLIGVNERQEISFPVAPQGGTFTLGFMTETTAPIAYNATAADVQSALEALSSIGAGNVAVTGGPAPGTLTVEFTGVFSTTDVPELTIDDSGLVGPNERQRIEMTGTVTGGTFTLSFGGFVTAPLNYDATAADVRAALESLPSIGAGNVTATGGDLPGTPIEVEFIGALAGADQPQIVADGTNLTGTTPGIVTSTLQDGAAAQAAVATTIRGGSPTIAVSTVQSPTDAFFLDGSDGSMSGPYAGGGTVTVDVDISNLTLAKQTDQRYTVDFTGSGHTDLDGTYTLGVRSNSGIVDLAGNAFATVDEVQQLAILGGPTSGNFTLTFFDGSMTETTGAIAHNADAMTVQAALEALGSIGPGNVVVSGTDLASGPLTIRFVGSLGNKDIAPLIPNSSGLTGGTAPRVSVATLTEGGVAAFDTWVHGIDTMAPTVAISDVASPRVDDAGIVTLTFSEDVTNVDVNDLALAFDDGTAATGGAVSGASNTDPIVITASGHGLNTGDRVTITGVGGNTAANGVWTVTAIDADHFELDGSQGNGFYSGGGRWVRNIDLVAAGVMVTPVNLINGFDDRYTVNLSGATGQDGDYIFTVLTTDAPPIQDSSGNVLADDPNLGLTNVAAVETWTKMVVGPTATITDVMPDPRLRPAGTLTIQFSEDVSGVDISDFSLTRDSGNGPQTIVLDGLTVTQLLPDLYELDLSTVTDLDGTYTVTLQADGSGIVGQTSGLPMVVDAVESFTVSKTIVVDSNLDTTDVNPGDGIVADASGNKTLRAAIMEANALAGPDIIQLDADTYTLSIAGILEDAAASGDLDITEDLTIRGMGAADTTIDAAGLERVFEVFAGATLRLEDLTITGGTVLSSQDGGAIRNVGTVVLSDVVVTGNSSEDDGGAILNQGTMTILRSTIANNVAADTGGAIRNAAGTLVVQDSTISGNMTMSGPGGGIYNILSGTVDVVNSTISGNIAGDEGGGIHNTATLSLTNVTITNNVANGATGKGGGVTNAGTATVGNTIIAGNSATGFNPDVDGTFTSSGNNLIGDVGSAMGFGASGDQVGTSGSPINPLLGPLTDNGGPTATHALLLGSPAIDAGSNALLPAALTTDQRGAPRILRGPTLTSNTDIGAFEFGAFFIDGTADIVDSNPGDGMADNGLRAAVIESNALAGDNVIILSSGTYALTILGSGEQLAQTGDLDVVDGSGGTLTIVGDDADTTIIDASALQDRALDVLNGNVLNLRDLTVDGGSVANENGGNVRISGTLDAMNVGIQNGTTNQNGGNVYVDGLGAATGAFTATGVVIRGGSAEFGGGLYNDDGTVTLTAVSVDANTAGSDGGGLYNDKSGTLTFTSGTLTDNQAGRDGGGFYNNDAASATFTASIVNGNTAVRNAGGLYNEPSTALTLQQNTISSNTATSGGGLYNDDGVTNLDRNVFTGNQASQNGGGIFNTSAGTVNLLRDRLSANVAQQNGGGLHNEGIAVLDQVLLRSNVANLVGGAIHSVSSHANGLVVTGATFEANRAEGFNGQGGDGGAIYFGDIGSSQIATSTFTDNMAAHDGGAVYTAGAAVVTIVDSTFEANRAEGTVGTGGYGGAVYHASSGLLTVQRDLLLANVAAADGGGLHNTTTGSIADSTFSGNMAGNDGGGISNTGTLNVLNATIVQNTAERFGGGTVNSSVLTPMTVKNTIIARNTADVDPDVSGAGYVSAGHNLIGDMGTVTDFVRGQNDDLLGGTLSGIISGASNTTPIEITSANHGLTTGNVVVVSGVMGNTAANGVFTVTVTGPDTFTLDGSSGNGAYTGGGIWHARTGLVQGADNTKGFQRLQLTAGVTGGTFKLIFAGQTTGNIAFNANAMDVQMVLEALPNIDPGEVMVSGGPLDLGPIDVTFTGDLAQTDEVLGVDPSGLMGGPNKNVTVALGPIRIISPGHGLQTGNVVDVAGVQGNTAANDSGLTVTVANEVQQLTLAGGPTGGTFTLTFDGQTTGNIAFNATAAQVRAALEALGNVNPGDVIVRGGPLNTAPITVEFAGTYAAMDVPELTADSSGLTGGTNPSVQVTTTVTPADAFLLNGTAGTDAYVAGGTWGVFGTPVDPLLGELQDNGGPTRTHGLLFGSPARDGGDNTGVSTTDQRGFPRIVDGDGDGVAIVDIGAVEAGFEVNSTVDTVDLNPGDGIAADENGLSTLRAAIIEANATPADDTVLLRPGVYELTIPRVLVDVDEDAAFTGDLDITDNLTLIGAGTDKTFIDARALDRVFHVLPGVTVRIRDLTIQGGDVEQGGGILNEGTLVLQNVVLQDNQAQFGGGVYNAGTLTLENVTLQRNMAFVDGGGLYNTGLLTITDSDIGVWNVPGTGNTANAFGGGLFNAGTASIETTTFYGNDAAARGGAIANLDAMSGSAALTVSQSAFVANTTTGNAGALVNWDDVDLSNVTFSGNHADGVGGAIVNHGTLDIRFTTLAQNDSDAGAGAIWSTATTTLYNVLVAANTTAGSDPDVRGSFTSLGYNLVSAVDPGTVSGLADGLNNDQVGSVGSRIGVPLGPLADNGGPTPTHRLLPGNPAIDAGNNTGGPETTDQRGALRPTDDTADIGAFEVQNLTLSINDVSQVEGNTGATIFNFTVVLSSASVETVTVDYTTAEMLARELEDFLPASGTLTFVPGQVAHTISVTVNGDTTIEPDETFRVVLSNPTNAGLDDAEAVGTIVNDDTVIRIDDAEIVEGDSGTQVLTFNVSLDQAVAQDVTVDFVVVEGNEQQQIQILGAPTGGTFTLSFMGDTTNPIAFNADAATVQSELAMLPSIGTGNVQVTGGPGPNTPFVVEFVGTLANMNLPVLQADASGLTGGAVNTAIEVTELFSPATVADNDFVAVATTPLLIPAGQTAPTTPVQVTINGDLNLESHEMLIGRLLNSTVPVARADGIGTIFNDEVALTLTGVSKLEGDVGNTDFDFVVGLVEPNFYDVTVDYSTMSVNELQVLELTGSPTGGTFTLDFDGEVTAALPFNASAADIQTALENLANIGSGDVMVTGSTLDAGPITIEFTGAFAGTNVVALVADSSGLVGGMDPEVTVTSFDIASPNVDFLAVTNGTVTIPAGDLATNATVAVIGDLLFETDERFAVSLSNPLRGGVSDPNAVLPADPAAGVIVNDDAPPEEWLIRRNGASIEVLFNGSLFHSTSDLTSPLSISGDIRNEFQEIAITGNPTGGDFMLEFDGQTTAAIPYNATAADVETALANLPNLDAADINVTGGDLPGMLVVVEFTGFNRGGTDVPQIIVAANNLTGGTMPTVTVTTQQDGGTASVDDLFIVDFANGNPVPTGGLMLDGLTEVSGDALEIRGDLMTPFTDVVYTATGPGSGTVNLDGSVITYAGLEPVTDTSAAQNRTFDFDALYGANDHGIRIANDFSATDRTAIISTSGPGFESISFRNPTASLTIDAGSGNDSIELQELSATFMASLTIDGGSGNDSIDASASSLSATLTGSAGDDTILAGSGSDLVTGGTENDSIVGGGGNDTIDGGDGNDTVDAAAGDDSVTGDTGDDSLLGGAGDDTLDGGDGADTVGGGDGADSVAGGAMADSLSGDAGNDTIDGGDGDDTVSGGADDDMLVGGLGADSLFGDDGDDSIDAGDGADTADGGAGADTVSGGLGDDSLEGAAGNDSVLGQDGNDTLSGGTDNDTLDGGTGDDSADGGDGADTVSGGADNDVVGGGLGDDLVEGGDGDDSLLLTGGFDTLNGNAGTDEITQTVDADQTLTNTQITGIGTSNHSGIEIFILNGGPSGNRIDASGYMLGGVTINGMDGNDTLIGGGDADSIIGGNGNDTIRGGGGADKLVGNAGNDTIDGEAGLDTVFGGSGDDSLLGGADDDTLNGQAGNDTLRGGDGNDTLRGNIDSDTLYGENGDDTLYGEDGDDEVHGGEGNDISFDGAGDDVLFGENGNDTMSGVGGDDTVYGNAGDDKVIGGAGNDIVDGGDGNDRHFGGAGHDTIMASLGDDTVRGQGGANDEFVIGPDAGADNIQVTKFHTQQLVKITENGANPFSVLLHSTETLSIDLADGNDVVTVDDLTGASAPEVIDISAGNGDDTVDGTMLNDAVGLRVNGDTGSDSLIGGLGRDTLHGDDGPDSLFGNDGDDIITGSADADTIDGGAGHDSLDGGIANDSIRGGDGDDTIDGGDGSDSIYAEAGADEILLGSGHDFASGGPENDTVFGGGGNDTIGGDDGDDSLVGENGNDILNGGAGNDTLDGGTGGDGLSGKEGNDRLIGAADNDTMIGGDGNDTLLGGARRDIGIGGPGQDFVNGQGDSRDTLAGGPGGPGGMADSGDVVVADDPSEIDEMFVFFADWIDSVYPGV